MIINSIRWRLQAWHGLILVTVLFAFGLTAYQVTYDNHLRQVDLELEQRMMTLIRPEPPGPMPGGRPERFSSEPRDHGPDRPMDPPRDHPLDQPRPQSFNRRGPQGNDFKLMLREAVQKAGLSDTGDTNAFYYLFWEVDDSILARSTNAPQEVPPPDIKTAIPSPANERQDLPGKMSRPQSGAPIFSWTRTRGHFREYLRRLPRGDCLLVGRSLAVEEASMRQLAYGLVAAGLGVLALGLAGGWWLATRAIRPIEDISATAARISAGDLSQRINAADADSELGRLAGVLNSTFSRLEAAFAQQARFTSDASHELRTPVSVILTQTQSALTRERSLPEYRETLEACQRAAKRMRNLTESLLELARLDAGQQPLKREPLKLDQVVRECIDLVRPLALQRGIELQCEMSEIQCLGDPERLSQVVTNLLTNAIYFNRDRGEVRISAQTTAGTVVLTVADTGEGIPTEDLPHIFERFYRVDKSRSRIQGRTGLGLAICRAIIDALGGTMEVSSQVGTGSTFRVRLPLD